MILASIPTGQKTVTVTGQWQHDYGQQLQISGVVVDAVTPVHFAVEGATSAEIRSGTFSEGVLTVTIPDTMLSQSNIWWAYVVDVTDESGQTAYAVRVIDTKPRPAGTETITPDDQSAYDALVAQLNLLIASVGEVNDTATASALLASQSAEAAAGSAEDALNNILNGVSTHNLSDASHGDIRQLVQTAESIARGRATAYVFDTYADMAAWLAVPENVVLLVTGDNLYIRDTGIKDYWWDGTAAQELEAEAPDLTDYYTKAQVDALVPITITQAEYDALVAAGAVEAGRIYFVI